MTTQTLPSKTLLNVGWRYLLGHPLVRPGKMYEAVFDEAIRHVLAQQT